MDMQETVQQAFQQNSKQATQQTVAIAVKGTKITADTLKKAIGVFLKTTDKSAKKLINHSIEQSYKGKQSLKSLMKGGAAISNIEITDKNIKVFEQIAKKYSIDFSLKKDSSENPPKYIVFFKGKDIDVINQAFKEFTKKQMTKNAKPSILKKIQLAKEALEKAGNKVLDKVKNIKQEMTR